jgi:hypothetical protein
LASPPLITSWLEPCGDATCQKVAKPDPFHKRLAVVLLAATRLCEANQVSVWPPLVFNFKPDQYHILSFLLLFMAVDQVIYVLTRLINAAFEDRHRSGSLIAVHSIVICL